MSKFEEIQVSFLDVACDGGSGALGHPKVYLKIEPDKGAIACPYCSRTYVLAQSAKRSASH